MEREFYTCQYCFKKFEPKRRRVQKYCSDTCRSKAYHVRQTKNTKIASTTNPEQNIKVPTKTKIETMSASGVGNAAIGSLAADGLKSLLTPLENKPATKGDLKKLSDKIIKRYHLVNNIPRRSDGALPYFDMDTGDVVYSFYDL
ncbi:hypothetical protein AAFN75_00210 [Algibacter sp. AS12]|uniref:hypothetical protein n=1 Tax=Algibacter sp. AS12 TaxID=3135773 RepID=UPI00398B4F3B